MEKNNLDKRLSKILKNSLIIFVISIAFALPAFASNTGLNWENPNSGGDNPYKLSTDAILNSKTLMRVIGCTGIVNNISSTIQKFLSSEISDLTNVIIKNTVEKEEYLAKICTKYKGNLEMAVAQIPDVTISQAIDAGYQCPTIQKTESTKGEALQKETLEQMKQTEQRKACFNGLAYTLAKNQLTSMTRETINWINTGFSGNPFYVQNIKSLTNSIQKNIVEEFIKTQANEKFPYGNSFAKTLINYHNNTAENILGNKVLSMASDLGYFLTDKDTWGLGETNETIQAKERAFTDDIYNFTNDFSVGGWNGYLALTQREQNNPLGYTMMASQFLADRIEQQTYEVKDEISQNSGLFNQKECVLWQLYDKNGDPEEISDDEYLANPELKSFYKFSEARREPASEYPNDKCVSWKNVTPGSVIKDKLSTYMNSPERQLELADDINSVLNNLFTNLIQNFRNEGILGLSQEKSSEIDDLIGYGSNSVNLNYYINKEGYPTSTNYLNDPYTYSSKSFNILKELGNTYIHDPITKLGKWDAKNNKATNNSGLSFVDRDGGKIEKLMVDIGIYNNDKKKYESPYYYLEVTTPGQTKLFNNGYNGWAKGDRVLWNGTSWQNWKAGEQSPIKKRGIIQIQKDYVLATREILKVLPGVMPKIGELDYCIPGPNPNFIINTTDTASAFTEYANTLSGMYQAGFFNSKGQLDITLAKPGSIFYDNYEKSVDNNTLFRNIQNTVIFKILNNFKNIINEINKESSSGNFLGSIAEYLSSWINGTTKKVEVTPIISGFLETINNQQNSFYATYKEKIKNIYETMENLYKEKENIYGQEKNTDYIPMIEEGYSVTKNMLSTSEKINENTLVYKEDIIKTESNISKLDLIKKEMDSIIKTAQNRRNEKIKNIVIPMIKKEYALSNPNMTDSEAYNQYLKDYKDCFDEEYIDFLDYTEMIQDTSVEERENRCSDGLDNDLDGFTDSHDIDCNTTNTNENTNGTTTVGDSTRGGRTTR